MRVLVLLIGLILSGCATATEQGAVITQGNRVCSSDFCVTFPGEPRKEVQSRLVDGQRVRDTQNYRFTRSDEMVVFMATFSPLEGREELRTLSDEQLREFVLRAFYRTGLTDSTARVVHTDKGRVIDMSSNLSSDEQGRPISLVLKHRIYVGSEFLFGVHVLASPEMLFDSDIRRFFGAVEVR